MASADGVLKPIDPLAWPCVSSAGPARLVLSIPRGRFAMVTTGRALEFGVLLHTADLTGDHVARPDLAPLWEQTILVEELGYDHVWVGDSSRIEIAWPRADCLTIMTESVIPDAVTH